MKSYFSHCSKAIAFLLCMICIGISSCKKSKTDPEPQPVVLAVTAISPTVGIPGTTVTITGTKFSTTPADNKVTFNGVDAIVSASTETSLTVKVPDNASSGIIKVQIGASSVNGPNFEVQATPLAIKQLSVNKGAAGTAVTITGTGFSTVTTDNIVTINGKPALVGYATATTLNIEVPLGAGTGKIEVKVGEKTVTGPNFEYNYLYQVITFAGQPGVNNINAIYGIDGKGSEALFNFPLGITLDQDGNLYIGDGNNCIRKVTQNAIVSTYAGINSIKGSFADGPKSTAGFNGPNYFVFDKNGIAYVSDKSNHRIRKVNSAGIVSTLAGSDFQGDVDGTGENAAFINPGAMALDANGDLYVFDTNIRKIKKVTSNGVVITIAGGKEDSDYADGQGAQAGFGDDLGKAGMVIDSKGDIFLTDMNNNCIRKITKSGMVSTYVGEAGDGSYQDGTLANARFSSPTGLAIDKQDNLYVFDGSRIRKITPDGVVSTLAGNGGTRTTDGAALQAGFKNGGGGLAVSDDGKFIYVTEYAAHCIRKIGLL